MYEVKSIFFFNNSSVLDSWSMTCKDVYISQLLPVFYDEVCYGQIIPLPCGNVKTNLDIVDHVIIVWSGTMLMSRPGHKWGEWSGDTRDPGSKHIGFIKGVFSSVFLHIFGCPPDQIETWFLILIKSNLWTEKFFCLLPLPPWKLNGWLMSPVHRAWIVNRVRSGYIWDVLVLF